MINRLAFALVALMLTASAVSAGNGQERVIYQLFSTVLEFTVKHGDRRIEDAQVVLKRAGTDHVIGTLRTDDRGTAKKSVAPFGEIDLAVHASGFETHHTRLDATKQNSARLVKVNLRRKH